MFAAQDAEQARDLSDFKDWWNLATPLLMRNLRDVWKKELAPSSTPLKPDAEGVWITQNNRRVFVTAGTQAAGEESWRFSIKPKSYEFLVLLCWGENLLLHDFVVSQKLYLEPWTRAKRAAGKNNIEVRVERRDGRYVLQLPDAAPIEITETEANYKDIAQ
jgi:tryptophanyl-tRNA synthetase